MSFDTRVQLPPGGASTPSVVLVEGAAHGPTLKSVPMRPSFKVRTFASTPPTLTKRLTTQSSVRFKAPRKASEVEG